GDGDDVHVHHCHCRVCGDDDGDGGGVCASCAFHVNGRCGDRVFHRRQTATFLSVGRASETAMVFDDVLRHAPVFSQLHSAIAIVCGCDVVWPHLSRVYFHLQTKADAGQPRVVCCERRQLPSSPRFLSWSPLLAHQQKSPAPGGQTSDDFF